MNTSRRHPLTLRFRSEATESAFQDEYVQKSFKQVRYALLLGVAIYGLVFGILDWLNAPAHIGATWTVRFVVCVLGLGVLVYTFADSFRRYMQPVLSLLFLVAGLGLMVMLAFDTSGKHFYNGPVLIILPTYVLLRLRFVYATVVGWLIVAAFIVVAVWIKDTPTGQLVSSIIFFSSANVIGMFAGYMLEDYARQVFWQTRIIDAKRRENEHLLEVRSRFFANVSHEFRTPLTLILSPLEALLDEQAHPDFDEALRGHLRLMRQNARRLLRFINQILDLAKLESGSLHLSAQPTAIGPFLSEIVHTFTSYAEEKQIELQVATEGTDEEADAAPLLYVDREKLEQVVVNLLSNALKFTPSGGVVRVSAGREGTGEKARVVLRVRDTGPGIPEQERAHIFERFASAGHESARAEAGATGAPANGAARHALEGTGIGLALAKELVELHHGTITVQSEPGFGSEFIVSLPLGRRHLRDDQVVQEGADVAQGNGRPHEMEPPALPSADAPAARDAPEEAPTLLIVEDHPDMRAFIRACLGPGYAVVEAEDGNAGLEKARDVVPDLIISDVMMPEMDGYAFCRALKADRVLGHIPVILLTAKASPESKIEGLEAGVDDYLYKPFDARELRVRIRNLLDNRRRLQQRFRREVLVQPSPIQVQSADDAFIEQAREAVEAHLSDEHFDVDAFAEAMGMSRRQLQRKLRAVADQSPNTFTRLIRLGRAAQLLEQQYGTVAEVAYAVGFSNPSYFSKCFRETFGTAPSDFVAEDEEEG